MAYNWNAFKKTHNLSETAIQKLSAYANMIIDWNEKFNLTAITKEEDIAKLHFEDALALQNMYSLHHINSLGDIGTGAGIPAIPLKICYPHLSLVLIEVKSKKRIFLQAAVDSLELTNVEIVSCDWRTFLRNTHYQVDVFCARASLPPEELIRMFKDTSSYKNSLLVYWASKHWIPDNTIAPYIKQTYPYTIGERTYSLIKMANIKAQ
ncbi:16S rRNA (guanine(527)-N(7))-methyltransferase RsmG [Candidatus Dependentiae bacterium]|nr:MAG: 16S rRNA (guanine(527)-N(7))-methyltransferase RsmG [Candidatus Dependentiae bacterium]